MLFLVPDFVPCVENRMNSSVSLEGQSMQDDVEVVRADSR
jgi:hypothetical protein